MRHGSWLFVGSWLALSCGDPVSSPAAGQGGAASGTAGVGVAGHPVMPSDAGQAGTVAGAGRAAAAGGASAGAGGGSEAAGAGAGGASPVELPHGLTGLFPLPGAQNVCSDPALRLRFASAPELGTSGKLRVFDVTAPGDPVVEIDFAASAITRVISGQAFNQPRPIHVDGNDVVLPLSSQALGYGKQYYVTLEAGAIQPAGGAFSISDDRAWRFSTSSSAPSGDTLSVALDGSGQFCSWQGALDAVPAGNTSRVSIDIASGTYHGLVYFSGKKAVTLRGADRKKTIFSGTNNDNLNMSSRGRALVGADDADGLVIEDLTIQNLTPQGGSQAEALRLQGCDECVVRRVDILSLQDTLLWSGRIYAEDCFIAGNVDFIWGDGAAYFNRCEIKTLGRSGYNVQSRNGSGKYGYVFVDSKLTSDAGITGNTLARIDVSKYPDSQVAYIDCTLGSHIAKAGWTISGGSAPASLRFAEYRSRDPSGALLDVSGRVAGQQLTAEQAALMRDPKIVLGGWQPPEG